jgi:hypothetical protein
MKYTTTRVIAALLIALPICFSACVKDDCKQKYTYTYYEPVYITKTEARTNVKSNRSRKLENPGKIYIRDKYIFLNEVDKGIHIIDNSNPKNPQNVAFITIPGNQDIAVKGNFLYADMYSDLLTIDISNPLQVQLKNYLENVFPFRNFGLGGYGANDIRIVADWIRKDTTITSSCEETAYDFRNIYGGVVWFLASSSSPVKSVSPIGRGGSMARFTLVNDRMYSVSTNSLDVFNVSTPENPVKGAKVNLEWNIETIYPFGNKLFIGSQTGMFIYDITNPDAPQASGQFTHARSCDPVIADNDYAYVTLRSGSACTGFSNQLDVIRLNNLANPTLVKTYPMDNPHGLSKDGNLLFICDGSSGVKVYDATNNEKLTLVKHIDDFDAYDVIAYNQIALIIGKDGLYQYSYSSPTNIKQLSKIQVEK